MLEFKGIVSYNSKNQFMPIKGKRQRQLAYQTIYHVRSETVMNNDNLILPESQPRSTIAPSEKHLEDWIVANFHLFGEPGEADWFPDDVLQLYERIDDEYVMIPFFDKLISQQKPLPSGRTDLIAKDQHSVCVVEIKRENLSAKTLAQCLRYIADVKEIFYWTFFDAISTDNPDHELYRYDAEWKLEITGYPDSEVSGMILGHGEPDPSLLTIAALSNIKVVTYEYDSEFNYYHFEHHVPENRGSIDTYKNYAKGAIGLALKEVMAARAAHQKMRRENWAKLDGAE